MVLAAGVLGFAFCLAVALLDCKPSATPIGADVEAGQQVADAVCSLVEGVDDNGTVRSVCATVDEVAQVVAFVSTLLRMHDAGPVVGCQPLPGTTFCATSAERAKGVLFLSRARADRLLVDAGRK